MVHVHKMQKYGATNKNSEMKTQDEHLYISAQQHKKNNFKLLIHDP